MCSSDLDGCHEADIDCQPAEPRDDMSMYLSCIGYPLALNNLGSIYYNGHGVRKDIAKSFPYFCRAAERGVESAQFTVATMLFYGQGVAVDKAKAKKWFQKAAAQGCKDSQNYLNSWVDD